MIKQDDILCQTKKSPLGPFNIKTCGVHPPSQTMDPGSSPGRQKYPVTPGEDPGSIFLPVTPGEDPGSTPKTIGI